MPSESLKEIIFSELLPELARRNEQQNFNESLNISMKNVRFGKEGDGDFGGSAEETTISYDCYKCAATFEQILSIQQVKMNNDEEFVFSSRPKETEGEPISDLEMANDEHPEAIKLLNFELPDLIKNIQEVLSLEEESSIKVLSQNNKSVIYLHVALPKEKQTMRSILFELAGLMYEFSKSSNSKTGAENENEIKSIHRIRFPFVHFGDIRMTISKEGNIKMFNSFGSLCAIIEGISNSENDQNSRTTTRSDEFFRTISRLGLEKDYDADDSDDYDQEDPPKEEKNETENISEFLKNIQLGIVSVLQNQMNLLKTGNTEDILKIPFPYLGVDSIRCAELEYHLSKKWPECEKLGKTFLMKIKTLEEAATLLSGVLGQADSDSTWSGATQIPLSTDHQYSVTVEIEETSETRPFNKSFKIPLSSQQKRILFISEVSDRSQFDEVVRIRMKRSRIEKYRLEATLNLLILRHSVLRTQFFADFQYLLSGTESFIILQHHIEKNFRKSEILPIRAFLEKDALTLIFNHIAIDGRSLSIFYQDFHSQLLRGSSNRLELKQEPQYYDFCLSKTADKFEDSEAYWKLLFQDELLKNNENENDMLPTDFSRNLDMNEHGNEASILLHIPERISDKINLLCKTYEVSKFELFMALLQLVLQHVFGVSNQFNLGYAVDLRSYEFSKTMGCFTNLLPFKVVPNSDGNNDVFNLLKNTQNAIRDGRKHGNLPYEKIVKIARSMMGEDHNWSQELFQIVVVNDIVDDIPAETRKPKSVRFKDESVEVSLVQDHKEFEKIPIVAKYDQMWFLRSDDSSKSSEVEVKYDSSLYKKSTIRFLMKYLFRLISQFSDSELIPTNPSPESLILKRSDFPKKSVFRMFKPNGLKLCYKGNNEKISQSSLCKMAASISARAIRLTCQLSSDYPLLIKLKRSPFLIKSIFAIWNAGFYPVPIHIDSTKSNVEKISKQLSETTPGFMIDEENDEVSSTSKCRIFNRSSFFDMAYVTCTSGSTGESKLVGTAFEGHSNLAVQYTKTFNLSENDVVCQVVDPSFDIFFADITKTFVNNSCLLLSQDQICSALELQKCTNAYLMPAFLTRLPSPDSLSNLQSLQYGGEPLPFRTIQTIIQKTPLLRIWQEFGLTEQTVYSARNRIKGRSEKEMRQIGEAYDNMKLTICNLDGNPTPEICLRGQLILEGCGLMRGYFGEKFKTRNDEIKEKRRFVTGDEVSIDENEEITFIGRKDSQVKVRGYRIDLFEIESVAMASKKVESCVCIVSGSQLSLFYRGISTVAELKKFLEKELVPYKIPSQILKLEEFPLTRTGKIDKLKLNSSVKISQSEKEQEQFSLPQNSGRSNINTALKLKEYLEIYSDAKIESIDADIFSAGVDSIAIMLAVQRMRSYGVELDTKLFFKLRSLRRICQESEVPNEKIKQESVNVEENDGQGLSYVISLNHIQQRILFLSRFTESTDLYRLEYSLPLPSTSHQNFENLLHAVNLIILGNRLLRSRITNKSDNYHFSLLSATECFHQLKFFKKPDKKANFDVFIWMKSKTEVVLSIHHIHCDARSLQILKTQLDSAILQKWDTVNFENHHEAISDGNSELKIASDQPKKQEVQIIFPDFVPGSKSSRSTFEIAKSRVPPVHEICFSYASALFKVFSKYYKSLNGIPIAMTFANRTPSNWNTVSMFANTLPIIFEPNSETLESMSHKISEMNQNSNVPLKSVISNTGPFSDFAINFHNQQYSHQDARVACQFPITFTCYHNTFIFDYDPKIMSEENVEQIWMAIHDKTQVSRPEKKEKQLEKIFCSVLKIEKIDRSTNFFYSGGHSLTAMKLIDHINDEMGLNLPIKTIFEHPTLGEFMDFVCGSETETGEMNKEDSTPSYVFPLCSQQLQMFYLSHLTLDSTEYQLPFIQPFPDSVSVENIHHALLFTMQHQNIFRTIFRVNKNTGEPYQQVVSITEAYIACITETFSGSELESKNRLKERIQELCQEPITVTREEERGEKPLIRAVFLKSKSKNVAFLHLHHLISDARSTQITNNFMRKYLENPKSVQKMNRPKLTETYANYCQAAQDENNSSDIDPRYLESLIPGIEKPKLMLGAKSTCVSEFLEVPASALLTNKSGSSGTPFSIILNAVADVLSTFFNVPSINIVFPVLNRNEKTANICGYFLNNLVVNVPNSTKTTSLHDIIQSNYSYSQVVKAFRQKCGNDSPISEVYLNCRYDLEYDETDEEEMLNLIPKKLHFPVEIDVDLFVDVFRITMRSDRISAKGIKGILGRIKKSIDPSPDYDSLSGTAGKAEQEACKPIFGQRRDIPNLSTSSLLSTFFTASPNAVFTANDKYRRYRDCNLQLRNLARSIHRSVIRSRGVDIRSDDLIAVIASKSIGTTLLCLSIQLAGAAYFPIDDSYPESNIISRLESSSPIGYISSSQSFNTTKLIKIEVNSHFSSSSVLPVSKIFPNSSPYDLAYVISTSGTTGTPKPVCIFGSSLSNLAVSSTISMDCSSSSSIFQFTNFVFDNSVLEIIMAIANQARLIYDNSTAGFFDNENFSKMIISPGISHCLLFPSLIQSLEINKIRELAYWIVGGERLSQGLLHSALDTDCHVIQNYGPTETTAYAVSRRMRKDDVSTNVGIPTSNTIVALENGELLISGKGKFRGYIGERSGNIFVEHLGRKWYRSGDICRIENDEKGRRCVIFEGRLDSQIKIRGFRVELMEIEKCIESHENVITCKTIFDTEEQNIAAFFTSRAHLSVAEIRNHCALNLEKHKIPAFFHNIAEFPLTKNSKIDMEKLKGMRCLESSDTPKSEASNHKNVARRMSKIWGSLLKTDKDFSQESSSHFFLIGGHSLLLIRLRHLIQTEFGITVNVPDLLNNLKFCDLVNLIKSESQLATRKEESSRLVNGKQKTSSQVVFFPALYGGCTAYTKLADKLRERTENDLELLYLDEEFGDSVEEVARKYKRQINATNFQERKLIFVGASAAGTFAFATSLLYPETESFQVDVILLDSGTYWELIEKLDYAHHVNDISHGLKSYNADAASIESFAKSSWQTLQILKNYSPCQNLESIISNAVIHVLSVDGSDLGWRRIVQNFKKLKLSVHKIYGDHYTMLEDQQHIMKIYDILIGILKC